MLHNTASFTESCSPLFALLGICNTGNIDDVSRAQHLAITQDGIRYVVDRHKTGCRLDCQDVGKVSKTVPYDKMCASAYLTIIYFSDCENLCSRLT